MTPRGAVKRTSPSRRSWATVRALALVVCLAAACTSEPPDVPSSAGTTPVGGPAFRPCAGRALDVKDSAVVEMFDPGGAAELAIDEDVGLTRDAIKLEPHLVRRDGDAATTLSATASLQGNLLDAPKWASRSVHDFADVVAEGCARAGGETIAAIVTGLDAQNRTGSDVEGQVIDDLAAVLAPDEPLLSAFRDVFGMKHPWSRHPASEPFSQTEPQIRALATAVDPATQQRLAAVVTAMAYAEQARLAALRRWYPSQINYLELEQVLTARELPPVRARTFDYAAMNRAGAAVALVVERLQLHLVDHPLPSDLDVTIATPLGEIVLAGDRTDDDRTLIAPALVVDQGGNDTYRGVVAGSSMPAVPLSALIDMHGDDSYVGGDTTATQGAGLFSFGFLLDRTGNDRYQATSTAQGAGFLGVGVVYDGEGDDVYQAGEVAQGAGRFGLGAAVDLSGNDVWRITSMGQGFGYVRGVGLLLDAAGDDIYDANDTDITKPSAQTADHNTSLAQGAASGSRTANSSTSLGGGVGLLADLAGRDRYSCGVFCQGTGYFFGHGVLYDAGGDDTYRGVWYVQGAGAHFALATLIDESGNDAYETVRQGSRGAGHDESAGFFIDGGGDDNYAVAKLSNGATSNVGFGFFVDASGADAYATVNPAEAGRYGQATIDGDFRNYRGYDSARAVALFLDMAGDDRYHDSPPPVKNGARWILKGSVSHRLGAIDMPAEQVGLGRDLG